MVLSPLISLKTPCQDTRRDVSLAAAACSGVSQSLPRPFPSGAVGLLPLPHASWGRLVMPGTPPGQTTTPEDTPWAEPHADRPERRLP